MSNLVDAKQKDESEGLWSATTAPADEGEDALTPGAEPEALTQLVRLIQHWAHSRKVSSDELAREVARAQRLLPHPPRTAVQVSTSWLKRVRSGRLLPSADGGVNVVDARYQALFLLVAQTQLGEAGRTSLRGTPGAAPSGGVDPRCHALVERWSDNLLAHWRSRGSAAESHVQSSDPLAVADEFAEHVDAHGTRNEDLRALGGRLARFLVNAAVSANAGEAAMVRLSAERARELVARMGDRAPRCPSGMEGQEQITNRFIRMALSNLAEKLGNGGANLDPMTAIIMVPILDKLVEVSCDLRQPGDPTLFAWLSAVVAPK